MKRKTLLAALPLLLVLGSCGTSYSLQGTQASMQVKPGMDREEVSQLLGNPTYHRFSDNTEQWEYRKIHTLTGKETGIIVNFTDGKVQSMDTYEPVYQMPAETVVVETPPPPHNKHPRRMPISETDFGTIYEKVKKRSFADEQLEVVEVAAINGRFSCNQCARLLKLFIWDDDRMKVLRLLASRLTDPEHAETVVEAFDSQLKQDEARRLMWEKSR